VTTIWPRDCICHAVERNRFDEWQDSTKQNLWRLDVASTYAALTNETNPAPSNLRPASRPSGADESRLVAAAKSGQTAAFDELCQSQAKRLLRVTYRITRNHEDAEDALQESFLAAFVHIKEFDERSSFATWITRIAINASLMILRKKRPAVELSLDDFRSHAGTLDLPAHAPDPEVSFARREREAIVRDAIRALRPTVRRALELQQLLELSVDETAKMMGLSLAAAKSRLFHGKEELRRSRALKVITRVRCASELHGRRAA
jgi:RNA polymerase sigma-70 factor (ECF subfamily)